MSDHAITSALLSDYAKVWDFFVAGLSAFFVAWRMVGFHKAAVVNPVDPL